MALFVLFCAPCQSQELSQPDYQDVITRLRATPERLDLLAEIKIAARTPEAKGVLNEQLHSAFCEHPTPGLIIIVRCAGAVAVLQALDPDEGAGEATLVRWVEEFLARSNHPPAVNAQLSSSSSEYTPEYKEWSRKQGWSPEEAGMREVGAGQFMTLLGIMGDPKLRPLFRRGLESNSYSIISGSTTALALLKDKESIPSILGRRREAEPIGIQPGVGSASSFR